MVICHTVFNNNKYNYFCNYYCISMTLVRTNCEIGMFGMRNFQHWYNGKIMLLSVCWHFGIVACYDHQSLAWTWMIYEHRCQFLKKDTCETNVDYNTRQSAICQMKTLNDQSILFCTDTVIDQIELVNMFLICFIWPRTFRKLSPTIVMKFALGGQIYIHCCIS